ncbi:hypothetical protein ABW20_dc0101716 [Dactylellina cionopaga]|nr:hypothetical protein ABW20_dc0101716 [Dactylellina cionopaga]
MENEQDYARYGYGPRPNQAANGGQQYPNPQQPGDQNQGNQAGNQRQGARPFDRVRQPATRQYTGGNIVQTIAGPRIEESKVSQDDAPIIRPEEIYYSFDDTIEEKPDEAEGSGGSVGDLMTGTDELEYDTGAFDENRASPNERKLSGRPKQLSRGFSGSNSNFDVYGATRQSLSGESPQYYRQRGTNNVLAVKKLKYDKHFSDAPNNGSNFVPISTLRRFRNNGVYVGRVTPAQLYEYITRPGIRPTDYIIVDTRGEDGDVRLDSLEQVQGRVRVIPFHSNRAILTTGKC